MPTYRVTDPDSGQTLRLTGDSPPTEQELEEIFSSQSQGFLGGEPQPSLVSQMQKGFQERASSAPERIQALQDNRPNLVKELSDRVLSNAADSSSVLGGKGEEDTAEGRGSKIIESLLLAAGGVGQAEEGALAGPMLAMQRGEFDSLGEEFTRGLSGESRAEFGDVYRALGAPEWAAKTAGLVTAAALDPLQLAKVARAGRLGLSNMLSRLSNAGFNKGKRMSMRIFLNMDARRAKYAIDDQFKFIRKETLDPDAAMNAANDMVRHTEDVYHKQASKAYDNLKDNMRASDDALDSKVANSVSEKIKSLMDDELVSDEVENVLNRPIRKSLVQSSATGKTVKTSTTKITTKITDKGEISDTLTGRSISDKLGTESAEQVVRASDEGGEALIKEVSKSVVKEVTDDTSKFSKEVYTVRDLLNAVDSGQSTSQRDWLAALMGLRSAGKKSVLASKIGVAIGDDLGSNIKGLAEANERWRLWSRILRARKAVIGQVDDFGGSGFRIPKAGNIDSILDSPETYNAALLELDTAIGSFPTTSSKKVFTKRLTDISAASAFRSARPNLLGVGVVGVGSVSASRVGLGNPAVIGAATAVSLGESSPRLSAITGRAAYQTGEHLNRFFTTSALNDKTPLKQAMMRIGRGASELGGDQAVVRALTNRNDN